MAKNKQILVDAELHQQAKEAAVKDKASLKDWTEDAIKQKLKDGK